MNSKIRDADDMRGTEFTVTQGVRYHYMDNLRALAMLAGIFFHAALAYSPMLHNIWLTADSQTTIVFDAVAWFSHLFRMPLFFLIAGFFACYLVDKRGLGGFLKNRTVRILVPFVLFLPLVWISFAMIIGWSLEATENPSPMMQLIAWMATLPDAPPPPVSTTHLWFLYNLFQFCLVYALLQRFGVLSMRWTRALSSPKFLVFVLPLLMVPALASRYAPHPAPEQFIPQLWSFGFFGLFFLVGSLFFRRMELIDELKPYAPWLLVASVGLYSILFRFFPVAPTLQEAMPLAGSAPYSGTQLLIGSLEACIAVHMTIVCLVAGKAFLDRSNRIIRFIADSSYWVYIIHLPVLWLVQVWLLDTDWNLWVEFLVSSSGTLAIGWLSYVMFVRWTPIGWLLNGRRQRPPTDVEAVPA